MTFEARHPRRASLFARMLTAVVEHAAANWERSCRYVVSQGGPLEEAGDIVNDAIVRCCESKDREVRYVSTYWLACVRRSITNYIRTRTHKGKAPSVIVSDDVVRIEGESYTSTYSNPEDEAMTTELAREIEAVLKPMEAAALARQLDGEVRSPGARRRVARSERLSMTGNERVDLFRARRRIRKLLACA